MSEPTGYSVTLTHYGRKSGKSFTARIWFVVIEGQVWIGSLDTNRSWVKNVRASGKAALDFGAGPLPVRCEWIDAADDQQRFQRAVRAKYWLLAPILAFFVKGTRCSFKTGPA